MLQKNFCLLALLAALLIACIGPGRPALAQKDERFKTTGLEKRLKRQFKLSYTELKLLRPLIEQTNQSIARTYGRYSSEKYRDDFISLLNGLRSERADFESSIPGGLNPRLLSAIRAVRGEFEVRILDVWLDDYLETLVGVLELDRLQTDYIESVLENEIRKRLALIVKENERHANINQEWQRLTNERDTLLKKALDVDQYRDYLSLSMPEQGWEG